MRIALHLSVLCLALTFFAAPARADERVESIATRPGVTVKAIIRDDAGAKAPIVILFMGGNGIVNLDSWDGRGNPTGNFLVRTRKHFAANGLFAVVPDAPSDKQVDGLASLRTGTDHTTDIKAVIDYARKLSSGPVFLVGTSRGTISAAAVAANLAPGTVAGVVLSSTLTRYNRGRDKNRVQDAKLSQIRVPVYLVGHKDDACYVTPFDDVAGLAKEFTAAPKVDIKGFTGGGNYRGSECGARTAHGYRGIEREVVADIAAWIKSVAGR